MIYKFDSEVAALVGINAAVIFDNIGFWAATNAANERNYFDGRYWTYNTVSAYQKLFPFLSVKNIRTALEKLESGGFIISGCYSENKRNRTKWYALSDKGRGFYTRRNQQQQSISQNGNLHLPKAANAIAESGKSSNNTNNKQTDDKHQGGGVEPSPPTESSGFMKWYADNINPAFGPRMAEMVADLAKHYGNDACIKAGDIALKNNKRSLSYIEGILKRWETEGYSEHAPRPEPRRTGQKSVQEMYDEGMEILRKGGLV